MTTTPDTPAPQLPLLFAKRGAARANSRDVAAYFGKEHRNVLRAIDNLIKAEPSLALRNFEQTPWVDPSNGQTWRSFDMDRDGFTLLAMGFTGPAALTWKLRYIAAFNRMEAEVEAQASAPAVTVATLLADPDALRKMLLAFDDR